ncbi:putative Protein G7c protein, partial [Naja naja]
KCGHGGRNDATHVSFSPGESHKKGTGPLLSSHSYLHKEAAEMAAEATKNFFVRDEVVKRNTRASQRVYEELASFSGGYFLNTKKKQLSKALGIVELSMNAASVKIAHNRVDGSQFSFPVDETLSEISISVKTLRHERFNFNILQPSGSNYTISIKMLEAARGTQMQRLVISDGLGGPIHSIVLNQTSDALGNILAFVLIHLDSLSPMLRVEGLSPGNLPFSRLNTNPIHCALLYFQGTLLPGGSLELSVQVVNDGSAAATFTFNVQDDLRLTQSFRPAQRFLKKGESTVLVATENQFIAKLPDSAHHCRSQNNLADSQQRLDCSQHIWNMTFSAEGAVSVQISPHPSALSCHSEEEGTNKKLICDYKSSCCSPLAEVLISDENGNMNNFTVDYNTQPPTPA